MTRLNNKSVGWLILSAVLLSSLACARGGQIQGGGSNALPPPTQSQASEQAPLATMTTASTAPVSTEAPRQPTQAAATRPPTLTPGSTKNGLSDQAKASGDELEEMLNKLNQMNQAADSLTDVP